MRSEVEMGSEMASEKDDVYIPNMDNLEEAQAQFVDNLPDIEAHYVGAEAEAHFEENWVGAGLEAHFEENFAGREAHIQENLARAEAEVEENLAGAEAEFEENLAGAEAEVEDNLPDVEGETPPNWEDCPLHNEGFDSEDEEGEDVYQFISLAHMCRDEQLFASYFEELNRHQEPPIVENDDGDDGCGVEGGAVEGSSMDPSSSSIPSTSNATKTTKRRKFSPIIDNTKKDARRMAEEADMLHDLANTGVRDTVEGDEEGGGGRDDIECRSFKLTDELPYWNVGDVFGDRDYFREVLRQYAVMSKRDVHIKINDGKRLRAVCRGHSCQWFVYLRKNPKHNMIDYVVQTLNRDHAHTCSMVHENKWITSKWLGQRFTEKIKANPHIPLTAIRQCVDEQFGSTLSRMKAYRAKEVALEGIYGKTGDQYKKLFYYKHELLRTHPESSVHIHYDDERSTSNSSPRFRRIYVCLGPLKIGWKRLCRPIIFLDACFLRGMYKGQLFTAIGIDPNNGWWPIAWAVAETESYEQWKLRDVNVAKTPINYVSCLNAFAFWCQNHMQSFFFCLQLSKLD